MELLTDYYKKHGWDKNTGYCNIETLKQYDIKDNIISKLRYLKKIWIQNIINLQDPPILVFINKSLN